MAHVSTGKRNRRFGRLRSLRSFLGNTGRGMDNTHCGDAGDGSELGLVDGRFAVIKRAPARIKRSKYLLQMSGKDVVILKSCNLFMIYARACVCDGR